LLLSFDTATLLSSCHFEISVADHCGRLSENPSFVKDSLLFFLSSRTFIAKVAQANFSLGHLV